VTAEDDRQTTADTSLSKQRVLTEAVRLADSEGVDTFSMRKLAGALGAGTMSLYDGARELAAQRAARLSMEPRSRR
jgi:hypothetical protein